MRKREDIAASIEFTLSRLSPMMRCVRIFATAFMAIPLLWIVGLVLLTWINYLIPKLWYVQQIAANNLRSLLATSRTSYTVAL